MREIDQELFDAVEQGNLDRVQRSLNEGADVLARNSHHTVLHLAIFGNNEEVIKLVLNKIEETQSQYIDAKDTEGDTPLMWAAEYGHVNVAEVLLDHGTDTEVRNNDGMTALHWAAIKNRRGVAKLLIDKGANIHAIDSNGKTPLDIAREEGHREIVGCLKFRIAEIFSKRGKYNEALQAYQDVLSIQEVADHSDILTTQNNIAETLNKQGKHEEASRIFQHVFDRRKGILGPDHPDTLTTHHNMAVVLREQGKCSKALHICQEVFEKQRDILGPDHPDTLMTRIGIANALFKQGKYEEAYQFYQEVFEKQRDILGPDHPDTLSTHHNMAVVLYNQGKYGEALHIYQEVFEKRRDILGPDHPVTLLTSSSIEIIQRKKMSIESHISLHNAAKDGDLEAVEYLISKSADVNDTNEDGWTPLHCAASEGELEVAEFLISKGANIYAKDNTKAGKKPIHIAAIEGHIDVIEFFLNKGISVDETDKEDRTPLYYAAWEGKLDTVEFLIDKGANIHAEKNGGVKPVHAATDGHQEVIGFLLSKGVSVDDRTGVGWTPLHFAAQDGHLEVVQFLLDKGANVHAKDNGGKEPIHVAVAGGHKNVVEFFLSKEVSVDERTKDNWTPLHCAASAGQSQVVKFLIEKGANTLAKNNHHTVLHSAVHGNNREVIKFVVDKIKKIQQRYAYKHFSVPDAESNTPLMWAAKAGKVNATQMLLKYGFNARVENNDGMTALHWAAKNGHKEVVKLFMGKVARIDRIKNAKDKSGKTPADLAREEEHMDIVYTIYTLHDAAGEGNLEEVKYLISQGNDVNSDNGHGYTPLHSAAKHDHLEVIKFLVDRGADINAKDKYGDKPIHSAAEEGYINVMKFFLNKGISINDTNNCGSTLLHRAAGFGHLEAVKFLVENGADVYAKDTLGSKPIHAAAEGGYKNIVEIFLDKGVSVDDANKYGWTPLHKAAHYGKLAVVKLLIDRGANVHAETNNNGHKPIHAAATSGYKNIVELFLSKGVSINDTDKSNWTPLHYAAHWSGKLEVVRFLIDRGANVHAKANSGSKPIDLIQMPSLCPSTVELLRKKMEEVEKEQSQRRERERERERERQKEEESCVIQSTHSNKEQQEAFLRDVSNTDVRRVKQGLYLPSFEARNVKINGKCTAITRGLSQTLLSQSNKSFLSNLETSAKIYEHIAQGKQVSKREEREVFAFSKLLDGFEWQLDSATSSLPLDLIHTKNYKTLSDLSNYIAGIKSDFAIHLVISNHVVAVYRIGDNYAYFDSNAAFVSGLESIDQLIEVVEKGADYEMGEKGLLVEHFNVDKANSLLSSKDKQVLIKEIKTERQLLAEQDKELGSIKSMVNRVQLYDLGTKINVEGSVPLLINADMSLSSEKFQDHLDRKEVSMTAREYLDSLKNSENVEKVIQATKVIPFIGSKCEIEEAEQIRKPKRSLLLEWVVQGMINIVNNLTNVFRANASQSESQLPEKAGNEPQTYLNDPTVDKQLQRSL